MLSAFRKPYRKFSEISATLGNSATIINLPNNYWGNSPTPDSSKDTFHQKSATISQRKSLLIKKCPRFARIYGTVNRFPVELKASEMVEEFLSNGIFSFQNELIF